MRDIDVILAHHNDILGATVTMKDMDILNEYVRGLALIQEKMRRYLERYARANGLPLSDDAIGYAFESMISGILPPLEHQELVRQYIDVLSSNPAVITPFKVALGIKIMNMTAQGMGSDAMRIVRNLKTYHINAMDLGTRLPDIPTFAANVRNMAAGIDAAILPVAKHATNVFFVGGGRYKLISILGRGGFGVVHRARDARLQRDVAIKHLSHSCGLPHERVCIDQLQREAMASAALNHGNIVQVYDFLEDVTGCYIVMEYIGGGSLHGMLALGGIGRLGAQEMFLLFEQIGNGLAHAHSAGIVHRDVKPSNILLVEGRPLVPKICDFGISACSGSLCSAAGTPLYMAPEQRRGGLQANAPTVDIYAFGKMIHECITGESGLVVDCENMTLNENLRRVLLKAVAANPEDRYNTISEMLDDLRMAWNL